MKKTISGFCLVVTMALSVRADVIARWDFNSSPPDNNLGTGTILPAIGSGSAVLVGGATATFATGGGSDPAPADNTGWNTGSYPAQGTGNKTAGAQFAVSTRNYTNITVSFDRRLSNTASRYGRLQYSTNGSDFIDFTVIDTAVANTFTNYSISFAGIAGVEENTNFAIRIVTEFHSTATGSESNIYVTATTSTNSVSGTIRFDFVTVSGDSSQPQNTPPRISDIADQTTAENTATGDITFTIEDSETLATSLMLAGSSSNTELVPTANIEFGGDGDFRSIRITPVLNQIGTATITITVTDEGGESTNDTFVLTVIPTNSPPTVSAIAHQSTLVNIPTPAVGFTVGDADNDPASLTLTGASSNPTLLPPGGIALAGAGTNRTVALTPAAGQSGTALITVLVSDGNRTSRSSFVLMVIPGSNVLLCESFGYPDGSLLTNSAFFWTNHSGIVGQLAVSSNRIQITSAQSEDVHAPLLGAPWGPASAILYASFKINFSALPSSGGSYFAHYNSGTFRCRVFSTTADAGAGAFQLGIANGSATASAQLPLDLQLHTDYLVVTRYNIDAASSTLWVNPASESDSGVTALDSATAEPITTFSFRQNAGIGTMTMDDLKVGTSFDTVVSTGLRLEIVFGSNAIEVSWPEAASEGYMLQSRNDLASGSWMNVSEETMVDEGRKIVRFLDLTQNRFFRLIKP